MLQIEQKMFKETKNVQKEKFIKAKWLEMRAKYYLLWHIMALNCLVWLCMTLYDLIWPCVASHGLAIAFHGHRRMVSHSTLFEFIVFSCGHRSKLIWSCHCLKIGVLYPSNWFSILQITNSYRFTPCICKCRIIFQRHTYLHGKDLSADFKA